MVDVVCNGVWIKGVAGTFPVDGSGQEQWGQGSGAGGGCWSYSWSMPNNDPNFAYDFLATGAQVEVYDHAAKVFDGWLDARPTVENSMQATAKGWVQAADNFQALVDDGTGNLIPGSKPDPIIDRAIAAGWKVKRTSSFCGVGTTAYVQRVTNLDTGAMTDSTATFNTVGQLLNAVALANGMRWGVNADRELIYFPDKTEADWILVPGTPVPGVTDPDFVTTIFGRFCYGYVQPAKTTGFITANGYLLYATTSVVDQASIDLMGETREASVDLTALGPLTGLSFAPGATNSPATTYAADAVDAAKKNLQGRLDLVKARIGWTNPLTPQWFQLLTPGGTPAPLYLVRAGDLVSIHGTLTPSNQLDFGGHRDVIVSAVDYAAGAATIKLDPLNMVSRDFGPALAAALAAPGQSLPDDVDPGNPQWFTA